MKSTKSKTSIENSPESAPLLEQFLQVMKPVQKNGPSWANDQEPMSSQTIRKPTKTAKPDETGPTSVDHETNEKDENISDIDWMRRHMSKTVDDEQSVEKLPEVRFNKRLSSSVLSDTKQPLAEDTTTDSTTDTILQTSRLFLRNLAFSCSDADLLELFKPFGEISQVCIFQ
jgi:multiple RNA-binding domain-containing protein 1